MRRCRSARSRSICSTERSAVERANRSMWASLRAKLSTAATGNGGPWAASAAATSAGVRSPSNCSITIISSGRKRKYLWVAGFLTM